MSWYHPKSLLDKIFEWGLVIKGISGLLELTGGLLLFFVPPEKIHNFISIITQKELLEDPHDMLATFLLHSTQGIADGTRIFAIAYLLIHAIIKLVAVIGILRKQLWAYPFSLISLSILTIYQFYSMYEKFSVGMGLLTLFDLFILWLIWREYGKARVELAKDPV